MVSIWAWFSLIFLGSLLACLELGYRIGQSRQTAQSGEPSRTQNILSGSVYALLTLLLSFSFSLAVQRFEARRHIVVDLANAIGTAYLRVDLFPESDQPGIRHELQNFADAQLKYGADLADGKDTEEAVRATQKAQHRIWNLATSAYQNDPHESTRVLFTPAINEMFDLAASRTEASETRTPWMIFLLLTCLSLASAVLAGRALAVQATRSWGHRLIFSAVLALVVFVVADLDDPRHGFIRIDQADRLLREARDSMNEAEG